MVERQRRSPIIVLTGTPGTGKSTHAEMLVREVTATEPPLLPVPLRHIDVGALVRERGLHDGYDKEWDAYTVDEDKVVDALEPLVDAGGGLVLDWHTCDVFPERWADLVVVLRCQHTLLWDRLEKRGYPLKKIQENNEAEIMNVVLDDASASYPAGIVVELRSDTADDMEENVARIVAWIEQWVKDNNDDDDDDDGSENENENGE